MILIIKITSIWWSTIIHNKNLDHQDQDQQHEQQYELVAGHVGDLDNDDPPEGNHPMARPHREARKPTTMPWHWTSTWRGYLYILMLMVIAWMLNSYWWSHCWFDSSHIQDSIKDEYISSYQVSCDCWNGSSPLIHVAQVGSCAHPVCWCEIQKIQTYTKALKHTNTHGVGRSSWYQPNRYTIPGS